MADAISRLMIDLSANVAHLRADMSEATRVAGGGLKQIEDAANSTRNLLGQIAGAIAVGAAVKHMTDLADNLGQVSKQSGLTVESLSGLRFAAEQNDTSFESLSAGLQKLRKTQAEAANGNGELASMFGAIGVSVDELKNMKPEELFYRVADGVKSLGSEQDRTLLLTTLMGKSADDLSILMSNGAAGIKDFTDEAAKLGAVMSGETAEGIKASLDNIKAMKSSAEGLGIVLLSDISGPLKNITDAMRDAAKEGGILEAIWVGLGGSMGELLKAFRQSDELVAINDNIARLNDELKTNQNLTESGSLVKWLTDYDAAAVEADTRAIQNTIDELIAKRDKLLHPSAPSTPTPAKTDKTGDSGGGKKLYGDMTIDVPVPEIDFSKGQKAFEDEFARGWAKINDDIAKESDAAWRQAIESVVDHAKEGLAQVEEFLKTDEERLADQYKVNQAELDKAHGMGLMSEEQYEQDRAKLAQKYAQEKNQIHAAGTLVQLQNAQELADGLAGIASATAGKQSGIYKALFAASKAFSIAEAIVKIQAGIANAAALPFPANLGAMATVASSTMGIVSTIKGTNLQGVAHAGMQNIPREGTYLLNGGERVLAPKQNQDLTKFLADKGDQGGGLTVNIIEDSSKGGQTSRDGDDLTIYVAKVRDALTSDVIAGGNNFSRAIENTYGVGRGAGARR